MTLDITDRVLPGQKFEPMSASAQNLVLESARSFAQGSKFNPSSAPDEIFIKALNDTGADLDAFETVGNAGLLFSPTDNLHEFWRYQTMRAVLVTTADHKFNYLISAEPIASGKIGRFFRLDYTPALIQVIDVNHGKCSPQSGSVYQVTNDTGSATIIDKEAGTGIKKGIIRRQAKTTVIIRGLSQGVISAGTSGVIDGVTLLTGAYDVPLSGEETVYLPTVAFDTTNNFPVWAIERHDGVFEVIQAECGTP